MRIVVWHDRWQGLDRYVRIERGKGNRVARVWEQVTENGQTRCQEITDLLTIDEKAEIAYDAQLQDPPYVSRPASGALPPQRMTGAFGAARED